MHHGGELLGIVMIHTVESQAGNTLTSAQQNCKICLKSAGLYESFVDLIDYITYRKIDYHLMYTCK